MRELCLKLDEKDIERLLTNVDLILKKHKVHITDFFGKDGLFAIYDVVPEEDNLRPQADELDFYFRGYNHIEFMNWIREHMEIFKRYMAKQESISTVVKGRTPSPKNYQEEEQDSDEDEYEDIDEYEEKRNIHDEDEDPNYLDIYYEHAENITKIIIRRINSIFEARKEEQDDSDLYKDIELVFKKTPYHLEEALTEEMYYDYRRKIPNEFNVSILLSSDDITIDSNAGLDLYSAIAEQSEKVFSQNADFQTSVRKYHDKGYIKLNTEYIENNIDILEDILYDVIVTCITPFEDPPGEFPIYNLDAAYIDSMTIEGLPIEFGSWSPKYPSPKKVKTPTPKAKSPTPKIKTPSPRETPKIAASPTRTNTPIYYKEGLVNFSKDGKRAKMQELPVDEKYVYKKSSLTVEKIRTMGKAQAFRTFGLKAVSDNLFYSPLNDVFIMIGFKAAGNGIVNLLSFEFKVSSRKQSLTYNMNKTMILKNDVNTTIEVTDYIQELYERYSDIILIYSKFA